MRTAAKRAVSKVHLVDEPQRLKHLIFKFYFLHTWCPGGKDNTFETAPFILHPF